MKVIYLVTGATGYLGNNIVRRLVMEGKRVRVLVLPGDEGARRIPANVQIYEGNVLNPEDLERFFTVPKGTRIIVIHSAGIVSTSWHYDQRIFAVNVLGARNVVEQCIWAQVKKLVYVSSVHALPELPTGQTITESSEFNPHLITGFYGKTKAMASQIVMNAARSGKLRATLVFPSGLYGPFDYATGYVTQLLLDCAKNRLPAGIEGGYDFVDVRDVAEGVVLACEKGADGEGYILTNRYVSATEMIRSVQEYTSARPVKCTLPVWVAQAFLPFFHLYYMVRRKRPLFTRYSLYTLTSNSRFSSEKARRELGFTTRPFTETIVDTLNWLRDEGKI
ncbi:MAG TPA: NAD-dependent epimerase/dehydratase family protein [Firmicutes bacterium]|nr:NAD-dependent epimerase/dehydratase family protein [Bacillota bacterium]